MFRWCLEGVERVFRRVGLLSGACFQGVLEVFWGVSGVFWGV